MNSKCCIVFIKMNYLFMGIIEEKIKRKIRC